MCKILNPVFNLGKMGFASCVICFLAAVLIVPSRASIVVPAQMLSPLGVPGSVGPNGMNAVKLAVGSRLLTMLGSFGLNPTGGLPGGLLGSQQFGSLLGSQPFGGEFGSLLGMPPITARSKEFSKRRGPNIPTSFDIRKATPTEVENFFGVLDRVDANKCISLLVCEVGADPRVLEGLGHNIKDVMSSLQVLEKNELSMKYRQIMMQGQKNGFKSCSRTFPSCDQRSYRLIKAFVKAFKVRN
ncbi:hypothetical protein JTE90_010512 [Oedothorax gibbosus]|uniref:Secreted protein n=1 Tax=Oedothorax gibbosus TaxID=931172 RepID=A0AAV6W2X1_9ARAC|nr:hypothetical protein JTE90_010512 [Oedothorax gibbosus]